MNAPGAVAPAVLRRDDAAVGFTEAGFKGPVRLFDRQECRRILKELRRPQPKAPWHKGKAAVSPLFYKLGTTPQIVDAVAELLGGPVMLWGATVIRRDPGQVHAWHTDIETASPTGRTVSVWIGLEHTNVNSSLQVIPGSHEFGEAVQEAAAAEGLGRGEASPDDVARFATARRPESRVMALDMTDGDAVFFDGRLWHGTDNTNRHGTRVALLLQYASPETPIRIPDPAARFEWPFRFLEDPRPPCLMVRETYLGDTNRIVAPPVSDRSPASARDRVVPSGDPLWPNWIHHEAGVDPTTSGPPGPPAADRAAGAGTVSSRGNATSNAAWRVMRLYRGSTRSMRELGSHISTLETGAMPHPPHEHPEEEVIILLSGEAEVIRIEGKEGREVRETLRPGSYVYHAAHQRHTIQSVGASPARYLIFKWLADHEGGAGPILPSTTVHIGEDGTVPGVQVVGRIPRVRLLDSQTRYLGRLRSHLTTLPPDGGYAPHADEYDVAIVVRSGTVETLGQRVDAGGVIFYAAGEPHGIRNVGDTPATYLVFEFHGGDYKPRMHRKRQRWMRRIRRRVRSFLPTR